MKNLILAAGILLNVMSGTANAASADQMKVIMTCHDLSNLPNGLYVQITTGGLAGVTQATVHNRIDLGPSLVLGSVIVHSQVASDKMGAPLTYTGNNFDLSVVTDAAPTGQGYPAHLSAEFEGKVYNQGMLCNRTSLVRPVLDEKIM